MVTHTYCAGFVWARLNLLDKNVGTSATFCACITEKSHAKTFIIFLTEGAYAHYATCMATPLVITGIGDLLRIRFAFSLMWYITLAISPSE